MPRFSTILMPAKHLCAALLYLGVGAVFAFCFERLRIDVAREWSGFSVTSAILISCFVSFFSIVALAALTASAIHLIAVIIAIAHRQMPALPGTDGGEPPGGAPVPSRIGPRKPAPLAAHAVPSAHAD